MRHGGRWSATLAVAALLSLAACGSGSAPGADPEQVDSIEMPELGACRQLTLPDISRVSDATTTVDCDKEHTAQTYSVGDMPDTNVDEAKQTLEVGYLAF